MIASDTAAALALYGFVTSITPGPNTMMLLASGVNFGLRRSMPHILGISVGFAVMIVLMGLGVGAVFAMEPRLHEVLRWAGALYLMSLAWRIATSSPEGAEDDRAPSRPMSFVAAAAFQWVNPKAWIMALGAITTYLPQHAGLPAICALAAMLAGVNAPCVGAWAAFGVGLRRILTAPSHLRAFNVAMAALLVLSLHPTLMQ